MAPMEFSEVEEVIESSYGYPWQEAFSEIARQPLGSASLAQVHRAMLTTGERVVAKVQRKGIHEMMSRDVSLLHRAVKRMPLVSLKDMTDLDMVLDEFWRVVQEEMDFLAADRAGSGADWQGDSWRGGRRQWHPL